VLGERTAAEVGRRHVAQALRRKPARGLGLALSEAGRERMSDAGPRRPSRGTSGGSEGRVRRASVGRGSRDLTAEGASDRRSGCSLDGRLATAVLAYGDRARDAEGGTRKRQGALAS